MRILVTGATGHVGRPLVTELLRRGHIVRALTRNPETARLPPEVEVVSGDFGDPKAMKSAYEGVSSAHLMTTNGSEPMTADVAGHLAELAHKAGVRNVTLLWSGVPGHVEQAVDAAGLAWTRLQPVEFMCNALGWVDSVRTSGVVRDSFPDERSAMVHEGDIAQVAAVALTEAGHERASYTLTGPEVLTVPDKVRILADELHRELRYVERPEEEARALMLGSGVSSQMADYVIGWHKNPPAEAYTPTTTVADVTGVPPRSFAEWAREHAEAFRS